MFKGPHVLQFPTIKFEKEVKFGSWSGGGKKGKSRVYTLDWSVKEERCRRAHEEWGANHWPDRNIEYVEGLPEPYNAWVKGLKFAIPNNYMEEIRRCTWKAVEEGNVRHTFDTMIRDMCCEIRGSFVSVAFRLIADCVYDEETNYFLRYPDKILVAPCLLYKFWDYQTGRGLLRNNVYARVDYMEDNIKWRSKRGTDDDKRDTKYVKDFLKALKKQEKIREKKAYNIGWLPAIGQSLGEKPELSTKPLGKSNIPKAQGPKAKRPDSPGKS